MLFRSHERIDRRDFRRADCAGMGVEAVVPSFIGEQPNDVVILETRSGGEVEVLESG